MRGGWGGRRFGQVSPFLTAFGRGQFKPRVHSLNPKEMEPWEAFKLCPFQRGQATVAGDKTALQCG